MLLVFSSSSFKRLCTNREEAFFKDASILPRPHVIKKTVPLTPLPLSSASPSSLILSLPIYTGILRIFGIIRVFFFFFALCSFSFLCVGGFRFYAALPVPPPLFFVVKLLEACLEEAMSFAVHKPVVHDFALVSTPIFPRRAYEPLRNLIGDAHNTDVESLIGYGRSGCKGPETAGKKSVPGPTIPVRLYEVSLMGSFLW